MDINNTYIRLVLISVLLVTCKIGFADTLFTELFDDTDFAARGWYDNTDLNITTSEHIPGSTASVVYHFAEGAQTPPSGGAIRKTFTETDEVYIRFYVKYSTNWVGSGRPYHPHEFFLLTNEDVDYIGPSATHLTAYVEHNSGVPVMSLQDSLNIDSNNINVNLINDTETRAVGGCNGYIDSGQEIADCYPYGDGSYRNEIVWKANDVYFSDSTGPYYKNDWHKIEATFKLNTIENGIAQPDGIVRYWYDDQLIINHQNVYLRTGQHPNMMFDKIFIAPYIGDGSPVAQTMWVDDLLVATFKPNLKVPNPPIINE